LTVLTRASKARLYKLGGVNENFIHTKSLQRCAVAKKATDARIHSGTCSAKLKQILSRHEHQSRTRLESILQILQFGNTTLASKIIASHHNIFLLYANRLVMKLWKKVTYHLCIEAVQIKMNHNCACFLMKSVD
jgi:hypothetical protein